MEAVGFDRAISGFLASKERGSAKYYRHHVTRWLSWCRDNAIDPARAGRMHIEGYIRWERDVRGISKRSVATKVSVVRGLYRYAYEIGAIGSDPGEHVKPPRVYGHSCGTFLDRDEASRFLAAAESERPDVLALCRVLLLCGLRLSEALSLDVDDYDADSATIRIKARKGDWCQTVSISSIVAESFDSLVSRRLKGPLIRGCYKRMNKNDARDHIARIAESIGAEGITPHSLRRSFATLSRDAGVPDRDIMASGGWSSTQMLDYYDMARRGATSSAPSTLEMYLSV